jgi:HEPN domain-containing protein
MNSQDQAHYRLRLAEGFFDEAREDMHSQRWRSCVSKGQLAAENAAKAVLGLLGPIGRTHNPSVFLSEALQRGRFPEILRAQVERLAECARVLGPAVHVKSDYGDEETLQTPWELFDEGRAKEAVGLAEEAVSLARQILERGVYS